MILPVTKEELQEIFGRTMTIRPQVWMVFQNEL